MQSTHSRPAAGAPPLAATLERVAGLDTRMDLSSRLGITDEPDRWVTISALSEDPGLLEGLLSRFERQHGAGNRAYAGTTFLRGWLWRLLTPVVAALLTERRVPVLRAENVALAFGEGGFAEDLAFLHPRFAALPDDPSAGHPDAVVLHSGDEMLGELREALEETHLPVLVPALREARVRRGSRALWSTGVDSCAEAFMYVGQALGREAEAMDLAEGLLGGPSALSGRTNYYMLEHANGSETTRVRNACCLYYKLGNGACFTCPRTTHGERLRRLAQA